MAAAWVGVTLRLMDLLVLIAPAIGLLTLGFGIARWWDGRKTKQHSAASAKSDEQTAIATDRMAQTAIDTQQRDAEATRLAKRPEVFGHLPAITGSGNIQVRLENRSDNLARNINVMLFQNDEKMGSNMGVPALARDDFWEYDLHPQGNRGFQPRGVPWEIVCEFDAPDDCRWRSTRVSSPGNQGSSSVFELLSSPQ